MNKEASSATEHLEATSTIEEGLGRMNLTQAEDSLDASGDAVQLADHEDEAGSAPEENDTREDDDESEPLDVEIHRVQDENQPPLQQSLEDVPSNPVFEDPTDEDDGEGEWITPDNVHLHKSKALGLLPSETNGKIKDEDIWAGCMTADFAMQNVLLQMSLNLVGLEGRRIEKVKTWVLRCHACYK
jgi:RNA-binding protein NOB1